MRPDATDCYGHAREDREAVTVSRRQPVPFSLRIEGTSFVGTSGDVLNLRSTDHNNRLSAALQYFLEQAISSPECRIRM
jgi:hypothetical protein